MRIAILLCVAITAGISAVAVQEVDKPTLLVFCGPGPGPDAKCPPCEAFKRDLYGDSPQLGNTLRRDFAAIRMIDVRRFPEEAARYKVDRWPTFIAVNGSGQQIRRIIGYQSPRELWEQLTDRATVLPISQSTNRKKKDEDTVVAPTPATAPGRDSNLSRRVECIDGVCSILQHDLEIQSKQATVLQQQLAEAKAASAELQKRLHKAESLTVEESNACKAKIVQMEKRIAELNQKYSAAESGVASSSSAGRITPIAHESGRTPAPETQNNPNTGVMKRVFRGLVSTAMEVGLTAAQSEVAIGLGAVGGPAGIAIAVGLALARARKKKALSPPPDSPDVGRPDTAAASPQPAAEAFKIENLPLQHIDYTSCWAEHWRNQHADPATALRELELYVSAWKAVQSGSLKLPGIDNPEAVFSAVNRWVNRQVTDHAQKALTSENTNHKVFYAHTWKVATDFIREGTFRLWKPNPPAADAIDDWVAARLTERLTQTQT